MAAPVKNTCPEIDKYIRFIKQTIVYRKDLQNMEHDDLYDSALSMSDELENCIGYLESLRSSNDSLRCWGETLTDELEESANYNSPGTIQYVKSQIRVNCVSHYLYFVYAGLSR